MTSRLSRSMTVLVVATLAFWGPFHSVHAQKAEPQQEAGHAMEMDHLRMVVNHGLEMLIGANMVMLAQMKMSPGLDQEVLGHGRSMMEQGKKTIQQILSGLQAQATKKGDQSDASLNEFVHDLAAATLNVADTLEKVKLEEVNPDTTTMHYFNILINQALETALEGSNLIMGGQAGTQQDLAKGSVERGRTMLSDARSIIIEIMGSRAMGEMHSRDAAKMPAMGLTHKLASDTLEVLDLLDSLPEGK